ncbi:MAG: hypothetical protein JXB35_14160 [Anaerolineae bacterium]|nr:hypothetical protein [Anaerolineae bacterium]
MVTCHEMKLGQILVCEKCGLELEVIKECDECGADVDACECSEPCTFSCCGEPLQIKA